MTSTEKLINLARKTGRVVLVSKGLICGIVKNNFAGGLPAYNSFIYDCPLEKDQTKTNGGLR